MQREIQIWREEKRWTLVETAKKAGLSTQVLHDIEKGHRDIKAEELLKLAQVFDKSLDQYVPNDDKNIKQLDLREGIFKIGQEYEKARQENFKSHSLADFIRTDMVKILREETGLEVSKYEIDASPGKGRWALIPWCRISYKNISTSAQNGYYITYLFSEDLSKVYLSLNQGWHYYFQKYGTKKGKKKAKVVAQKISKLLPERSRGFTQEPIDLKSEGTLAVGYEATHILGRPYELSDLPSNDEMLMDLKEMLELYKFLILLMGEKTIMQFNNELLLEEDKIFTEEQELNYQDVLNNNEEIFEEAIDVGSIIPRKRKEPILTKDKNKRWPRDPRIAKSVLLKDDYQCSVDSNHETFMVRDSEHQYMEAHHLIPISVQMDFENTLDCAVNIITLCPNCHRKIHYGTPEEVEELLKCFFNERREQLKQAGIKVTLTKLKEYYSLD